MKKLQDIGYGILFIGMIGLTTWMMLYAADKQAEQNEIQQAQYEKRVQEVGQ